MTALGPRAVERQRLAGEESARPHSPEQPCTAEGNRDRAEHHQVEIQVLQQQHVADPVRVRELTPGDQAEWEAAVRAARPDVIYALLNWRAVPLAHEIVSARLGIRFVFHFKEAPQRCIARGEWAMLSEVVQEADTCVFASDEERAWFHAALPGLDPARTHAMDGDLPKREWLDGEPSPRLSRRHGDVHTVLLGRPYGWSEELSAGLRERGVHVHVHAGPRSVGPEDWVRVLSRYDAGWLHPIRSTNGGDIRAATWDDLNLPSRMPTLLAAGLPLILPRNPRGSVHAAERVASEAGAAILYEDLDDLAAVLTDPTRMEAHRSAAWDARPAFAFDAHVDRLVEILRGPGSRSRVDA